MVVGSAFPAVADPAWDDYKAAVKQYAKDPGKVTLEQNQEQSAWVSMMVFAQVARTVKGDLSSSSMLEALNGTSDVQVKGLTPPLDFTKPFSVKALSRLANRSVYELTVKDGEIASSSSTQPIDISDLLVKANGG
jgi:hypothetical protein